jgi:AraC family transcriptional regulator
MRYHASSDVFLELRYQRGVDKISTVVQHVEGKGVTTQRNRAGSSIVTLFNRTYIRPGKRPLEPYKPAAKYREERKMKANPRPSNVSISRHAILQWPGLKIVYAWEPPDEAVGTAKPNQVEIVFTAHSKAAFETRQRASQIDIAPGAAFIVGADTITWFKVDEQNESLGIYPDMDLLRRLAQTTNARCIELETTIHRQDPILLGIAHAFKRACVAEQTIADIEASSLAHLVARRLLVAYCGVELPDATLRGSKMSEVAIRTVCDFIEEHLSTQITLEELAALVHLSPFHFARCFKATMGLAPHQYVIARRMELAKQLLLTPTSNISEVAWSIGYENISHFRRLFAIHIGVAPGVIRRAAGIPQRA